MWGWSRIVIVALITAAAAGCWRVGPQDDSVAPDAGSDTDSDVDTGGDPDADADSDADADGNPAIEMIELTPATGQAVENGGDLDQARGYHVIPAEEMEVRAVEWKLKLPGSGHFVQARICDDDGEVLATGTQAHGDGTEQWYRSEVEASLDTGQHYFIAFSFNAAVPWAFDFKDHPVQPYSASELFLDVWSALAWGEDTAEACPDTNSNWAPFMRVEVEH
jgi:hypothetical protein